jgi:metal iron transporter
MGSRIGADENKQALSAKLGCVTGMDLAQMNRAYLPRWLNWGLYLMAEAAIICTDIGQVSSPSLSACKMLY